MFHCEMMKLLVLDLNGLLFSKVQDKTNADLMLNAYGVMFREGYKEFLESCYSQYRVGFYSSTTQQNAWAILDKMLTKSQRKKTVFFWCRDRTILDPDWNEDQFSFDQSWDESEFLKDEIVRHSTIKLLTHIWNNPIINCERRYSEKNTLICDDSSLKLRLNLRKNCLIAEPFPEETLHEVFDRIQVSFEELE